MIESKFSKIQSGRLRRFSRGEQAQKLALEMFQLDDKELETKLTNQALAIEHTRLEANRLDAEAAQLLGDDAYYRKQRLAEIERKQGDIAEDLIPFVRAFLGKSLCSRAAR